MKTIYNTFVKLDSQKQANKLKNLCIQKGLNYYWNDNETFKYTLGNRDNFVFDNKNCFLVSDCNFNKIEVTEAEFIKMINE